MLEVRNLCKTYKSKKGDICRAVDNVSMQFPESGFVFILGKSGSGKSTLLNLLGGLDSPDKGEIIIDGKSLNTFKQTDFDAYRNNYVGFVFQDFGMINDISVGENIKLALELQGKDVSNKAVEDILNSVDLKGFEHRNVNELSGGQKQRVAVARALIKNPKIIFADEPTGNLDSNSTTQVLNLFKKLSKDRLVIAVSHDIDSALTYADRIIEMHDGKNVSDKKKIKQLDLNKLKSEYNRKIDRAFEETTTALAGSTDKKVFESVKTKLPFKHSVKLGISNFSSHKIRFMFTILLTIIALTVFGASMNLKMYSASKAAVNTFSQLGLSTIMLSHMKMAEDEETGEEKPVGVVFSENKLKEVNNLASVYSRFDANIRFNRLAASTDTDENNKFLNSITGLVSAGNEINDSILKGYYGAELITGTYPAPNNDFIEILISDYTADSMLFFGVSREDIYVAPNASYTEIVGKRFESANYGFKIVGIYSTNYKTFDFVQRRNAELNFNRRYVYSNAICLNNVLQNWQKNNFTVYESNVLINTNQTTEDVAVNLSVVAASSWEAREAENDIFSLVDIKFASGYSKASNLEDNEIIIEFKLLAELLDKTEVNELGELVYTFSEVTEEDFAELSVKIKTYTEDNNYINRTLKIVGVYNASVIDSPAGKHSVLTTNRFRKEFINNAFICANVYMPLSGDKLENEEMVSVLANANISAVTYLTNELTMFEQMFLLIAEVLDYTTIALFVMVFLLIYNFIATSITGKMQEIGILRAMGARGTDISKIFMVEGIAIAIINFLTASAFTAVAVEFLNTSLTQFFTIPLSIVSLNPVSILFIFLSCFTITALACTIPLIRIIRMKPVKAIKSGE